MGHRRWGPPEGARTGFWGFLNVLKLGIMNILRDFSLFTNILACLYFYYTCRGFVDTCNVAHFLDTGNPGGGYAFNQGWYAYLACTGAY
jgi:hypothetical protein